MGLALMDTSLAGNVGLVMQLKQDSLEAGFFEAFLESAPQFIFQCSIVLRTGITSEAVFKVF